MTSLPQYEVCGESLMESEYDLLLIRSANKVIHDKYDDLLDIMMI